MCVVAKAKDIRVSPIKSSVARQFIAKWHYSGKPYLKSQLHLGAFLNGRLVGVMQLGDPLDRRKVLGLVSGTKWHDMMELNRMAMVDDTPLNSESRFISIAMRIIRQNYPHLEWILSFADACQCGDGTIYRASGWTLTGIKKSDTLYEYQGEVFTNVGLFTSSAMRSRFTSMTGDTIASVQDMVRHGAKRLEGFQMRYIYFLNPQARDRLTVAPLDYSRISEYGASMYKGQPTKRGKQATSENPSDSGGAAPTSTLHTPESA